MPGDARQSITVARLQAQLREEAAQHAEIIAARPFTLFVRHSGAAEGDGLIIPDGPTGGDLRAPLAALHVAGHERGSRCRVTFIAEFAPDLAPVLRAAGFVEEGRAELLACTPGTLRPPPAVAGLTMVTLSSASSLDEIREGLDTNQRGFNPQAAPATEAAAAAFRQGLVGNRAFTARLAGRPVGAGMFNPPRAGVAELVGITTLEPFRRRGIAAALTAFAARTAFDLGVDLVYLSADNDTARRVYERLGFLPRATRLTYRAAQTDSMGPSPNSTLEVDQWRC